MKSANRMRMILGAALLAATAIGNGQPGAQSADPNAAPNPYREDVGWAKLPAGRKWGMTIGIAIDRDGKSIWVFDRCGARECGGSTVPPLQKFDAEGNLVTSIGAGVFNRPHGLFVDRDNNIWTTDDRGHAVRKFSQDGKLLMTLGRPGVAGDGLDTFHAPSAVLIAPNGDIFVGDGHGPGTNARMMKFSKDGKFIKTWGKRGTAPSDFETPHWLAMDLAGRLFVGDRGNNRIQIFDQEGTFLAEWKQFGRPSSVFIDNNDMIHVADSQSDAKRNPGFKQGIRIGSVKDGRVTAFIPDEATTNALEGTAADPQGNVYAGFTGAQNFKRFVKK